VEGRIRYAGDHPASDDVSVRGTSYRSDAV